MVNHVTEEDAMFYTTREVADFLGIDTWRVQRVFEHGLVDEPTRIGNSRAIPKSAVPQIIDALRAKGWLG